MPDGIIPFPENILLRYAQHRKRNGLAVLINGKMHLSEIGRIASQMWYEIPVHFPFIGLDAFVVMPDHIHGIIVINKYAGPTIAGALHATPLHPHDATPPANETHVIHFTETRFIIGRCTFILNQPLQNMRTNLTVDFPGNADSMII